MTTFKKVGGGILPPACRPRDRTPLPTEAWRISHNSGEPAETALLERRGKEMRIIIIDISNINFVLLKILFKSRKALKSASQDQNRAEYKTQENFFSKNSAVKIV